MKSKMSLKMGHLWSKTRYLGQILEKLSVCSRSHIFGPILMKFGQNACLLEISQKFGKGSCQVKNSVTRSNLGKFYYFMYALEAKVW